MVDMGCTDGYDDYVKPERGTDGFVRLRHVPMQKMQAAQLYDLWLELEDRFSRKSKLVKIRTLGQWQKKEVGWQSAKFFSFTCVDQDGHVMEGEMTEEYRPDVEIRHDLCFVTQWDTPLVAAT
jgi:hypothetical protein